MNCLMVNLDAMYIGHLLIFITINLYKYLTPKTRKKNSDSFEKYRGKTEELQ